MKQILVVCSNGLGSSLILKSNIEKVLKEKGIEVELEHCDLGSAASQGKTADLVVTSPALAEELGDMEAPVVTIVNFISKQEVEKKVLPLL
ncbi:PTS sugar transporter subunit IIB [Kroppenstedtia sanguinis]|uniref:PTS sugar transporter subunit IIB n=1 Tax=Kroppenstedtia sanguinis TaxID=1380684 RepID=A0ABW4C4A0_9BACL